MKISTWLVLAGLGGVMTIGSACARQPAADATGDVVITVEKPSAVDRAMDATGDAPAEVGSQVSAAASATGEAITDGWITTKVAANFVDEPLLKGSNIDVDTEDHVVTLTGTVGSEAGKERAAVVAFGTEGVSRIVNQLSVT
jgi:hyperosmotically inducible periplasmic protein